VSVGDLFCEGEVFRRVELHQTGAENSDGATFGRDGSLVCSGVDSAGEAGNDGKSGSGELVSEFARGFASVVGELAGADDADGMNVAFFEFAPDVENDGGVV